MSNFWRSLEMSLINCKIHLELNCSKDCIMSITDEATIKIRNRKLYVPIVTLSSKDNAKLVKLWEDGFSRPVYWNEYHTKIETRNLDNNNLIRFPLHASFQGVIRLFVLSLITRRLLFLIIELTILPIELKETITENIFCQE